MPELPEGDALPAARRGRAARARAPVVRGRCAFWGGRRMPELPEVEALASFLRERAVGRVVARVDTVSIAVLQPYDPPPTSLGRLEAPSAPRHGKFLDLAVG